MIDHAAEWIFLEDGWVGIHTHRTNQIVGEALRSGRVTELAAYPEVRPEVPYGRERSRIDFLLSGAGLPDCFVEVKNTTWPGPEGAIAFPDAVKMLAQKFGMTLPEMSEDASDATRRDAALRESLLKAHETAAAYFAEQLASPAGARARQQLKDRGVAPSTIEQLGLGYAPVSRDGLKTRLLKQGFAQPLLLQSGLVVQRENGDVVDRFRNRLTIEIRDGRVQISVTDDGAGSDRIDLGTCPNNSAIQARSPRSSNASSRRGAAKRQSLATTRTFFAEPACTSADRFSSPIADSAARLLRRLILANAYQVEVDKAGRILLPQNLRTHSRGRYCRGS